MFEPEWVELYRQEGAEFRSVRMTVRSDGQIKLKSQDMGTTVREFWGVDEYEYGVRVSPSQLPKLVWALLRERYAGRSGAVDEFTEFCKKEGIEHGWDSW